MDVPNLWQVNMNCQWLDSNPGSDLSTSCATTTVLCKNHLYFFPPSPCSGCLVISFQRSISVPLYLSYLFPLHCLLPIPTTTYLPPIPLLLAYYLFPLLPTYYLFPLLPTYYLFPLLPSTYLNTTYYLFTQLHTVKNRTNFQRCQVRIIFGECKTKRGSYVPTKV